MPHSSHPYLGLFLVFEGIDGSGKSTQARRLAQHLQAQGDTVVLSKEPTDGPLGSRLRTSALSGRLPFEEELNLFLADRQDHLQTLVIPALQAGHTVILDRYFYSTLAYQGLRARDEGVPFDTIEPRIRHHVLRPDMTLWIATPPELAVSRIVARDGAVNHFERLDNLIAIDRRFAQMATTEPTFTTIDGRGDADAVFASVLQRLSTSPLTATQLAQRTAKSAGT